ncbi:MAG: hypothetical protein US49_C0010G0020 [candidate division TM6 bacterium GW2011_GWF2_37_49]|nr:MAG: hypothetical protein US49_C0010G0020 [candidate division TM6 bacterium GW2011_GWF2_37_49]
MFKNIKYIFISVVVAAFFAVNYFVFKPAENNNDVLVVGMMSGWAPFMTVNQNGEFEGFDVDVAQKIADKLGKQLVIKDFGSLSTLLVAMQQNKIDFVMSGLDITTSRLAIMDMVPYTGQAVRSFYLLFWNQLPASVSSIQDLQQIVDPVVCVEPGSAQAKYLDQFKFIQSKSLSKIEDMILDVKYGKSLAMIVEPRVAERFIRSNPDLKKLELPLPADFQTFGMGIGFAKNSALTKKVATLIQNLRSDGTLATLERKWELEIGEKK